MSLSDEDFRSWVAPRRNDARTVGDEGLSATVAGAARTTGAAHVFDRKRTGDLEMMQALVDALSEDDLDEAEVAMDEVEEGPASLLSR